MRDKRLMTISRFRMSNMAAQATSEQRNRLWCEGEPKKASTGFAMKLHDHPQAPRRRKMRDGNPPGRGVGAKIRKLGDISLTFMSEML